VTDESQWIKQPLGINLPDKPTSDFKLSNKELAILGDYLDMWTRNTIELLDKLKDTTPESSGMLAEIYYWRDISRVLDAINDELNKSFVEVTLQILGRDDVDKFLVQKNRVSKGAKEAKWNTKYLKILQNPV